jgi:flagellar basal-body rod protein FlgB
MRGTHMFNDASISALHAALNGLSARQRAVSDDIANVNTPNFTARRVNFEADLKAALAGGDDPMSAAAPSVVTSTDPYSLTNNNVDLDAETVLATETSLRYDLALRATGDRFSLLRTAARGA